MNSWRSPKTAVALLIAALLVAGARYRGHSVESMDVRTYAQMIRGVAEHGLPYWDNGPIDRFPELVVQWGVPARGHIWGIYGLLYPYLVAPIFRLGGLERVSGFTLAMLAPLALVTFLLARRVVEKEWTAAGAAALVVGSTPIAAKSLEITPFGLTAVFATLGLYFSVRLVEGRPTPILGLACGVTWAAAGASHALCFPMAIGAMGMLALAPAAGEMFGLPRSVAGARSIAGVALARLGPTLVGFIAGTMPVAFVNHLRFGSYNPISYGPIPWTGLVNQEILNMTLGAQLRYSALPVLLALVVAVGVYLTRRRRLAQVAVVVLAGLLVAVVPQLREHVVRYALVGWGYLVDMSTVDMGPAYKTAPGGVGRYFAGWVIKSTLQCTPVLVLAPLALRRAGARLWPLLTIFLPCVALFASFVMRANLAYPDAFGWPWVYIRYTFAALPGLLVMSLVVVERLRPRRLELGTAAFLAVTFTIAYLETNDDTLLVKRFALLVLPLAAGIAAIVLVVRSSRLAVAATMLLVGLGVASAIGHDLRANVDGKRICDGLVDRLYENVPQRFAVVGVLGQFDVLLTSVATRDVEYADLLRLRDWTKIRPLLEHWWADGRPVYFVFQKPPTSPWPDITFRPVPVPGLYVAEKR